MSGRGRRGGQHGLAWDHGSAAKDATDASAMIQVTQHDVLSGRGVYISQHKGNERFRALVQARHDATYCHSYSTTEKRAVAEEIIEHIMTLDPPGRFLRRAGKSGKTAKGLEGPWEVLSREEAIKKTCQALRDCNRPDRSGYAAAVQVPADVEVSKSLRTQTGMTNKQLAQKAALQAKIESGNLAREREKQGGGTAKAKREELYHGMSSYNQDTAALEVSHSNANVNANADHSFDRNWPKRARFDTDRTPITNATPATAASSGVASTLPSETSHHIHHHDHHLLDDDHYSPVTDEATALLSSHMPASPTAAACVSSGHHLSFHDNDDLGSAFDDSKSLVHNHHAHHHSGNSVDYNIDPLHLAAVTGNMDGQSLDGHDVFPPSPLHTGHHHDDDDDHGLSPVHDPFD